MLPHKVGPGNAQAAVNAVQSGQMTYRLAATMFGISKNIMFSRLGSFAWQRSFTAEQIKASFMGAGLWPVDMQRALHRLKGTGKRTTQPDNCPPLAHMPVTISEDDLKKLLASRTQWRLRVEDISTTSVRKSAVMLSSVLKAQERATRPGIPWSAARITKGGLLPHQ